LPGTGVDQELESDEREGMLFANEKHELVG
jgi:hypothetical protein